MKQVLAEPEEGKPLEPRFKATERYSQGWTDPRMNIGLGQGVGAPVLGRVTTSNTSIATKIKQRLGIE